MTIENAIARTNNPTEWIDGNVFSFQIVFENENHIDETSFDVDCTTSTWRDEIVELWKEFAKENNINENSVIEIWSTLMS